MASQSSFKTVIQILELAMNFFFAQSIKQCICVVPLKQSSQRRLLRVDAFKKPWRQTTFETLSAKCQWPSVQMEDHSTQLAPKKWELGTLYIQVYSFQCCCVAYNCDWLLLFFFW